MYGRRRAAAILPASRRQGETAQPDSIRLFDCANDPLNSLQVNSTCTLNGRSRAIGVSYLSSSSSSNSSRSSSPPIASISRLSHRVERHHFRTRQLPQRSTMVSRSRRRLRSDVCIPESNDSLADSPSQNPSSSVARQAVSVNSKSATRARRRALLRSPIFQLIISPTNGSSSQTDTVSTASNTLNTRASNVNNSVEVINTEEHNSGHLRTTRSRRRVTRNNAISQRTPMIHSRSTSNINVSNASTTSTNRGIRRSRSSLDSSDVRAALAAVRSTERGTDDECVICLCEKLNRSIVLPCMHTFCFDCIYRWLCINPSCPLCKRMTQRIIHSVLSDTEFTEILVSDLPNENRNGRISGLSNSLDLEDDYLNASPDDTTASPAQHHYRHHFGAHQLHLINYLSDITGVTTSENSFLIPPIIFPNRPSATISQLLDNSASHRWNHEPSSSVEIRRSLLTLLVNNALRPRDSSLLDSLLLRQLVYIFSLDSLPVPNESGLVRDVTPEFLAANETYQHRLCTFIRRELRVLAPWLAYDRDNAGQQEHEYHASASVTAPLISGIPGLESTTAELDRLTNLVVQHFCTVSITDEQALVDLLSNQTAFHSSLVPRAYLYHFASEVLQFAQFSGSLNEYDLSVCLYRRRVTLGGLLPSINERERLRHQTQRSHPDARLAVYVASACWPRLCPGFSQPQGLITCPLINWLLQRLFVHAVSGGSHPNPLPGTGEFPSTLSQSLICHGTSVVCHPNCSRLANSSRALLEAVPTLPRLRIRSSRGSRNAMSNAELFSSRLLYQRILSELIDQSRFSEAVSEQFTQYNSRNQLTDYVIDVTTSESLNELNPSHCVGNDQTMCGTVESRSSLEHLQPATCAHPSALRRLDGLLLLFTARIPGVRSDSDDLISELLHMPLLPMTTGSPTVIDLTSTGTNVDMPHTFYSRSSSRQSAVDNRARPHLASFAGIDWNFLRQLPPASDTLEILSQQSNACIMSDAETAAMVEQSNGSPVAGRTGNGNGNQVASTSVEATVSSNEPLIIRVSPSGNWRDTTSCVVISSDDDDGDDNSANVTHRTAPISFIHSNMVTSDESDQEHEPNVANTTVDDGEGQATTCNSSVHSHVSSDKLHPSQASSCSTNVSGVSVTPQPNDDIVDVQDTTANLSLDSLNPRQKRKRVELGDNSLSGESDVRCEEPMDVDEAVPELQLHSDSAVNFYGHTKRVKLDNIKRQESQLSQFEACEYSNSAFKNLRNNFVSDRAFNSQSSLVSVETSDSDCELIGESIRLSSDDSDSSIGSCLSSVSESCSDISSTAKNRHLFLLLRSSNRYLVLKEKGRDRHCRNRDKQKADYPSYHRRRSCCCYCHFRRRRRRKAVISALYNKKCSNLSKPRILNRPTSPIIISDDNDNDNVDTVNSPVNSHDSNVNISTNTNVSSIEPNEDHVHSTLSAKQLLECSIESPGSALSVNDDYPPSAPTRIVNKTSSEIVIPSLPIQSSSKSGLAPMPADTKINCQIFAPSTANEFYFFLAKFESNQRSNPSVHSEQSADNVTLPQPITDGENIGKQETTDKVDATVCANEFVYDDVDTCPQIPK